MPAPPTSSTSGPPIATGQSRERPRTSTSVATSTARAIWTATESGGSSLPWAIAGSHESRRLGFRTGRDAGSGLTTTAGHGWEASLGDGHRTTGAAGNATRPTAGDGIPAPLGCAMSGDPPLSASSASTPSCGRPCGRASRESAGSRSLPASAISRGTDGGTTAVRLRPRSSSTTASNSSIATATPATGGRSPISTPASFRTAQGMRLEVCGRARDGLDRRSGGRFRWCPPARAKACCCGRRPRRDPRSEHPRCGPGTPRGFGTAPPAFRLQTSAPACGNRWRPSIAGTARPAIPRPLPRPGCTERGPIPGPLAQASLPFACRHPFRPRRRYRFPASRRESDPRQLRQPRRDQQSRSQPPTR